MSVKKYKKKPVVIEAMQLHAYNAGDAVQWIMENGGKAWVEDARLRIETLEGTMSAQIGDYVIKGVQGEFYPCKPNIFEETYESFKTFAIG